MTLIMGLFFRGNVRYSHLTDDYGYVYLNTLQQVGTNVPRAYLASSSSAEEVIGNTIL